MENKLPQDETDFRAVELAGGLNGARPWHPPVLSVFDLSDAQGDPTISDDGLGDGLFS